MLTERVISPISLMSGMLVGNTNDVHSWSQSYLDFQDIVNMTYHQMYRRTTLGNTLQEALDELVDHKLIQQRAAMKVSHILRISVAFRSCRSLTSV